MPSRDAATGRRIGGAEQNRRKKDRLAQEAQNQAARPAASPPGRKPLSYSDIPPPDLDDPASVIAWGARVLAVVCDQVMLDPAITEEQRRRELRDGIAKLGLIRDKFSEQAKIEKILRSVRKGEELIGMSPAGHRDAPHVARPSETRPVGAQSLAGVEKPDTARRIPPHVERPS